MKTLTDLLDANETDADCRSLIDGRSGSVIVDENGAEDSPNDYEVLREYEFDGEKFAAVRGPSGDIDAVDFVDGCRLYRGELEDASGLIFWIRDCHPACIETTFRMVGFTNSAYEDGGPEVGYTGEFCESMISAKETGCGDNGLASGYAIREYINELFVAEHECDNV